MRVWRGGDGLVSVWRGSGNVEAWCDASERLKNRKHQRVWRADEECECLVKSWKADTIGSGVERHEQVWGRITDYESTVGPPAQVDHNRKRARERGN